MNFCCPMFCSRLGSIFGAKVEGHWRRVWVTEILYCLLHPDIPTVFCFMLFFFCLIRVLCTAAHYSHRCHTCGASQITSAVFLCPCMSQSACLHLKPCVVQTVSCFSLFSHWSRVGMCVFFLFRIGSILERTAMGFRLPALKKHLTRRVKLPTAALAL